MLFWSEVECCRLLAEALANTSPKLLQTIPADSRFSTGHYKQAESGWQWHNLEAQDYLVSSGIRRQRCVQASAVVPPGLLLGDRWHMVWPVAGYHHVSIQRIAQVDLVNHRASKVGDRRFSNSPEAKHWIGPHILHVIVPYSFSGRGGLHGCSERCPLLSLLQEH